jgi:hypothetical protein
MAQKIRHGLLTYRSTPTTAFIDGIKKEDTPQPNSIRKAAQPMPAMAAPVSRLPALHRSSASDDPLQTVPNSYPDGQILFEFDQFLMK